MCLTKEPTFSSEKGLVVSRFNDLSSTIIELTIPAIYTALSAHIQN